MNMKVKQILDFSKSTIDPNMSTFDWDIELCHSCWNLRMWRASSLVGISAFGFNSLV